MIGGTINGTGALVITAFAFAAIIASVSPWCGRRSKCPTITQATRAFFSISALRSPVNALDISAAQFCQPIATWPAAASTARVISVEGGQIRISVAAGPVRTAAAMRAVSAS